MTFKWANQNFDGRKTEVFKKKVIVNLGSIFLTMGMTVTPQLLVCVSIFCVMLFHISDYSCLQNLECPIRVYMLHGLLYPGWGTITGRNVIGLFIMFIYVNVCALFTTFSSLGGYSV